MSYQLQKFFILFVNIKVESLFGSQPINVRNIASHLRVYLLLLLLQRVKILKLVPNGLADAHFGGDFLEN